MITIVGTRPQFIKAAEVSLSLLSSDIKEIIVHTGQHYDYNMSDVFFSELDIPKPAYQLNVGSGLHGAQTGQMLKAVEEVLVHESPDAVIVYGDTNSTIAGALAAVKLHVPVLHVEAGLRSFNRQMPEEINRILTDNVSSILFCPTRAAVNNLVREGFSEESIVLCGDVMFDSVLRHSKFADKLPVHRHLREADAVLVTIHRAENTDNPTRLRDIVVGLLEIASHRPVVFPLHPRTKQAILKLGLYDQLAESVACIDPLSYREMLVAQKLAALVITDSGGVQKEAFFLGKPSVVVRDQTEWIELVENGFTSLVEPKNIVEAAFAPKPSRSDPVGLGCYGDGNAAACIVRTIQGFLQ